jgi:sec-independent protein translocase protein TatA
MAVSQLLNIAAQIEGIEWIILLIILAALFLFGPQKLPELARGVGRALGEFQRGRMEIEREIRGQFAQLPSGDVRSREERVAAALGLATTGKGNVQLKIDIARAIDTAPDEKVTAAAAAIGVASADADIPTMRERILKALAE